MRRMILLAFATLCLLLLAMAVAAQNQSQSQPPGVGGEWELTFEDPSVKGPVVLALKEDGENVSGTYGHTSGKGNKLSGTFRGADLELSGGNRILPIGLSAFLNPEGTVLKGSTRVAGKRFSWTARRKGAMPQSPTSQPSEHTP